MILIRSAATPCVHSSTITELISQRFAPIVDYFEGAISRLNTSEAGPSTPPDAQYQYQRALALSKTLGDNLYVYSEQQLKYLQAQSVIAYVYLYVLPFLPILTGDLFNCYL